MILVRGTVRCCLVVILLWSLTACQVDPKANYQTRFAVHSGTHVVEEGESLKAIAARYHQDFADLAKRNGIRYPYWIHPGQIINLKDAKSTSVRFAEFRPENQHGAPATRFPEYKASAEVAPIATSPDDAVSLEWGWPVRGRVIDSFSKGAASPGIDIAAKEGEPVLAAADGEVKYLGEQVRGLGKVVIVSHGNGYVTVYAHNRRFLTQVRQAVKKGDVIAEVGMRPDQSTALHFQVRFNGKPVDPMIFLP